MDISALVQSLYLLTKMISENRYGVEIQYSRLVTEDGNRKAQQVIEEVFEPCATKWRGIGTIEHSGLKLRKEFEDFNVEKQLPVEVKKGTEPKGCLCGNILKGLNKPTDCPLFGKKCTPSHPVGACMVSSEGSCQAYFNFREVKFP
jgi:hydrogenase expression/formation protein HypD